MSSKRIVLFTIWFLHASAGHAEPGRGEILRAMALKEMRETTIAARKADEKLIKDIDNVSDRLSVYLKQQLSSHKNELFPAQEGETEKLSRLLSAKLSGNPYITLAGANAPKNSDRIKISFTPALSSNQAGYLREHPPKEWCGAQPGSIQVMHNGYDTAVIWGANLDGKPVVDSAKNRLKLVSLRTNLN